MLQDTQEIAACTPPQILLLITGRRFHANLPLAWETKPNQWNAYEQGNVEADVLSQTGLRGTTTRPQQLQQHDHMRITSQLNW
jgi:hypothetical protein